MRTTSEVIDLAIRKNRIPTYLLYGFSVAFVLTGMVLIGWAMVEKQPLMAVAGIAEGPCFGLR
jgi:hypothetical protein